MTAVAPPPSFQPMSRNGWPQANGSANGANNIMNGEDVGRMLMPRKTAQRTNSSSSLSSNASSNSTISAGSTATNPTSAATNGDWGARKRTTRGIWPPTGKTEPVSGLSTARPQSITSASSNASAASGLSALQAPTGGAVANSNMNSQMQANGHPRGPQINADTPVLFLTPMNGTFERKTIAVPFYPDVLRIGRQTNGKTVPTPHNGYFDSKVLSRQHAEVWANRQGQVYIRDVKSSNGTFVNGQRLSQENKDSEPHELREADMVELGIDIVSEDQKTVVHHKVAARVEVAGFYGTNNNSNNILDMNFGDFDTANSGGLLGQSLSQAGPMRRSNSQNSIGSLRGAPSIAGSNISSLSHQRQNHFWLTPVNMDQIVKKLNAEYKAAKQQSADLQRAAQSVESLLAQPPTRKEGHRSTPSDKIKPASSAREGFKTRFSDPPAPPPAAPLPEKPDIASAHGPVRDASMRSSLRRSDTAKPQLPGNSRSLQSDPDNAAQIASLSEALNAAKRDFDSQSQRLKELEDLLSEEKRKREDAEDRAKRLESERSSSTNDATADTNQVMENGEATTSDDTTTFLEGQVAREGPTTHDEETDDSLTKHLQHRLDQLISEFKEVKLAAERWRHEKEQAERERDVERSERLSLASMVEKLRAEEAERIVRRAKRAERRELKASKARSKALVKSEMDVTDSSSSDTEHEDEDNANNTRGTDPSQHGDTAVTDLLDSTIAVANGSVTSSTVEMNSKLRDLSDSLAMSKRPVGQFMQAAPVFSAVSVVVLGVAIMALINKMQAGEK